MPPLALTAELLPRILKPFDTKSNELTSPAEPNSVLEVLGFRFENTSLKVFLALSLITVSYTHLTLPTIYSV